MYSGFNYLLAVGTFDLRSFGRFLNGWTSSDETGRTKVDPLLERTPQHPFPLYQVIFEPNFHKTSFRYIRSSFSLFVILFLVFHILLPLFLFYNVIARLTYIPSSIWRQDSNLRPLSCKSVPLTTWAWLLAYYFNKIINNYLVFKYIMTPWNLYF